MVNIYSRCTDRIATALLAAPTARGCSAQHVVARDHRSVPVAAHIAGSDQRKRAADTEGMTILTIIFIAVIVIAACAGLMLDDPVGDELDRMRGESEVRSLLTPLFSTRP